MAHLRVARRFCGPPNSANGGYVAGLLASFVKAESVEVTLRAPPPLDKSLAVRTKANGTVTLLDAERVVATAQSASEAIETIEVGSTVSFTDAVAAAARTPLTPDVHQLPGCFVCGPARRKGEGLLLSAGPVIGNDELFAVPWVPDASLANGRDRPAIEFLWAVMDCPTGYAAHTVCDGNVLLGRMTAQVFASPVVGEQCVVTARVTGYQGRKVFTRAALFGANGQRLAIARNTWITVSADVQQGRGSPACSEGRVQRAVLPCSIQGEVRNRGT